MSRSSVCVCVAPGYAFNRSLSRWLKSLKFRALEQAKAEGLTRRKRQSGEALRRAPAEIPTPNLPSIGSNQSEARPERPSRGRHLGSRSEPHGALKKAILLATSSPAATRPARKAWSATSAASPTTIVRNDTYNLNEVVQRLDHSPLGCPVKEDANMRLIRTALLLACLSIVMGPAIMLGTTPEAHGQQCPNGVCQ